MKQILQGVEHMHKKRIVHLDLKVGDSSWLLWSPSYKQGKVKVNKKQKRNKTNISIILWQRELFLAGPTREIPSRQDGPT